MDRGAWWATVHGITELDMSEQLSTRIRHSISYTKPHSFGTYRKTCVTSGSQIWISTGCGGCEWAMRLWQKNEEPKMASPTCRGSAYPIGPWKSGLPGLPLFITEISSQYYSDNDFELFFFFLVTLPSLWDLSSSTKNQTCVPCSGRAES